MDAKTEKIFNLAFDPRGNEQEAIAAFLKLRSSGDISGIESKVENEQKKNSSSYSNSNTSTPKSVGDWYKLSGSGFGMYTLYDIAHAYNVLIEVSTISDLSNGHFKMTFRYVSYTSYSIDFDEIYEKLINKINRAQSPTNFNYKNKEYDFETSSFPKKTKYYYDSKDKSDTGDIGKKWWETFDDAKKDNAEKKKDTPQDKSNTKKKWWETFF